MSLRTPLADSKTSQLEPRRGFFQPPVEPDTPFDEIPIMFSFRSTLPFPWNILALLGALSPIALSLSYGLYAYTKEGMYFWAFCGYCVLVIVATTVRFMRAWPKYFEEERYEAEIARLEARFFSTFDIDPRSAPRRRR
ncbi:hypothetical protein EK21DRAFT_86558 [Setomelanomma holmii]|uniref:Uncharacterized protein n=1 Tax=Setomelanomma holmii TaxID=210430 RepID=A0A9P4LPF7_9PLEO|nr:hypothetical protein EK21DRAFT_86558 [Setomelanomma holmii]